MLTHFLKNRNLKAFMMFSLWTTLASGRTSMFSAWSRWMTLSWPGEVGFVEGPCLWLCPLPGEPAVLGKEGAESLCLPPERAVLWPWEASRQVTYRGWTTLSRPTALRARLGQPAGGGAWGTEQSHPRMDVSYVSQWLATVHHLRELGQDKEPARTTGQRVGDRTPDQHSP